MQIENFIILNGPPKSGKDTIANLLKENNEAITVVKFSQPIRDYFCWLLGITDEELEATKDDEIPALGWKTLREGMIAYSEQFAKPLFGEGWLGTKLAKKFLTEEMITSPIRHVIVADGGFYHEFHNLRAMHIQAKMALVRVYRRDTSFRKDSRSYLSSGILNIDPRGPDFHELELTNNTVPEEATERLLQYLLQCGINLQLLTINQNN